LGPTFQSEVASGFRNREGGPGTNVGIRPFRGVAVHNHLLPLGFEEVVSELEELDIEYGLRSQVEVGGFPGTQMEATVPERSVLWRRAGSGTANAWWIESGQRMRFIIVDTQAGYLLITIGADVEEWDDFLPVAEEILAGISFPDL